MNAPRSLVPRQNTLRRCSFPSRHAYFYIYDNHKNLHNLNSQMLSSTKHLFQQIQQKAAYVWVLHTTTGNSIKFYTFWRTHEMFRKGKSWDFFCCCCCWVQRPFNKVHNVNDFDWLYMRKNCWSEKGDMMVVLFWGICIILDIFNLNVVWAFVMASRCCE